MAQRDKRLKLYDIILRVNNIDFTNIKHQAAINMLRESGQKVQLLIRRLSPSMSEEIELEHNGKLGISIAGGIGNEYFQTDHGIFITDINKYQTNKQLDIGDRLLQISSTYNIYDLRFVTHENARKYIQLACAESQKVKLAVGHSRPLPRVKDERFSLRPGQYDPNGSKEEDSVQVNKTNYSTVSDKHQNIKSEHHYEKYETVNTISNEVHTDKSNEEKLIVSFDFDDYQRYENRGKALKNPLFNSRSANHSTGFHTAGEEQSNSIKFTTAPAVIGMKADCPVNTDGKTSTVNDAHQNPAIARKVAQQPKLDETKIRDAQEEKLRRAQSKTSQRAYINRFGAALGGGGGLRWQVD